MGQNPVTFVGVKNRGSEEKFFLTIGRLHIIAPKTSGEVQEGASRADGQEQRVDKPVTIALSKPKDGLDPHENQEVEIIGNLIVDEDDFIVGLQQLFPNGELENPALALIRLLQKELQESQSSSPKKDK